MKVRKKSIGAVSAIRVKLGTSAWPDWLAGHLTVKGQDGEIEDGGYLVRDRAGVGVEYVTPEQFAEQFDRVRQPKTKEVKDG